MRADPLITAIQKAVRQLNGSEFSTLVGVARRTGDRWLTAIRDGDTGCLPPGALARLVRHELHQTGSSTIIEALLGQAASDPKSADAVSIARCITAIAASQQLSSNLIERMAEDIADGILSPDEARRLLPLLDNVIAIAQSKCRSLTDMSEAIRRQLAPKA